MNEISDIPAHVLMLGAIVLLLLLLSIPLISKTLRNKNNLNTTQKKLGPKGSLIFYGLSSIVIYSGCYVTINEHYEKIEQSYLSLSLVITSFLFGVMWSVQFIYFAIKAIKSE